MKTCIRWTFIIGAILWAAAPTRSQIPAYYRDPLNQERNALNGDQNTLQITRAPIAAGCDRSSLFRALCCRPCFAFLLG